MFTLLVMEPITKVTNATGNFMGIMAEPIVAADSDYATSLKLKGVWCPSMNLRKQNSRLVLEHSQRLTLKKVKFNDEISLAVDTAGTQADITGYQFYRGKCRFNLAFS